MADGHGIRLRDVVFGYPGGFELAIADLAVARGACVAVVGPSGSGKTTLLHLLAGILPVRRGSLVVDGVELARAPERRRREFRAARIGLVFQEFELLEHLSVRENVLLPYLVSAALRIDGGVEARVAALARATGIEQLLPRRPRDVSQGERQRVAICRALVTEPALVLADEPTGNLDPGTTDLVLDLLLATARASGTTLVMVTHDHRLLDRFDAVVDLAAIARPEAAR